MGADAASAEVNLGKKSGEENLLDLPESHLRRITATLRIVDERLDEIERWVSGSIPSGPLYQWRPNLDSASLARIGAALKKAREELEHVTRKLGLASREITASSAIMVAALFSLIDLDELEPKRMKGCGALAEEKGKILMELWEHLRPSLEEIHRACQPTDVSPSREEREPEP